MPEDLRHIKLKKKLKQVFEKSGFIVDREVCFNFSGERNESGRLLSEASSDIVSFIEYNGKRCLLLFECKSSRPQRINSIFSSWERNINSINNGNAVIINSQDNKIKAGNLERIDYFKFCLAIGDESEANPQRGNCYMWNINYVKYFEKIVSVLENWTKYEIFKEFGLHLETSGICKEDAVEIKQYNEKLYLLGMHPDLLLKICYVSRRATKKDASYQRILSRERIKQISDFLSTAKILVPNSIIIAFDKSEEVQKDLKYREGKLEIPKIYCSAWIIDGQHRVYGFLGNRKYDGVPENKYGEFKLPIIAFKKIDEKKQSKAFIDINYYQKKIDPTLLCDLSTMIKNLRNELTWSSLLIKKLNTVEPLKDKITVSELDKKKSIKLSSFVQYGLLETLLGYNKKTKKYKGTLFQYAKFKVNAAFENQSNQLAFRKQWQLLQRFFNGVYNNTKPRRKTSNDPWENHKEYSLLKPTGINALLLVLNMIIEKHPRAGFDFAAYLQPINKEIFERDRVANHGGGWKGFRNLANEIILKLNRKHGDSLRIWGEKDKI